MADDNDDGLSLVDMVARDNAAAPDKPAPAKPATPLKEPANPAAEPTAADAEPVDAGDATPVEPDYDAEFFDSLGATIGAERAQAAHAKYSTAESYLKAREEAAARLSARDEEAAFARELKDAGWGRAQIAEALTAFRGAGDPAKPDNKLPAWDDSWVEEREGKIYPTALAPPDIGQRYKVRQERIKAFSTDPDAYIERIVAERLKSLGPELDQRVAAIASQRVQQTEADLAAKAWTDKHRDILFANGDESKPTPLANRIAEAYQDLSERIPLLERLEKAKRIALAEAKPTPVPQRVRPAAVRTPNVAAPGKRAMSTEEFWAKNPNASLQDFNKVADSLTD